MTSTHYEHPVDHEGKVWSFATAVRGARAQFVAVLMTALFMGLGLLPMALGSGEVRRKSEAPSQSSSWGALHVDCIAALRSAHAGPAFRQLHARFRRAKPR